MTSADTADTAIADMPFEAALRAKMAMPGETEQQRKLRMCELPRHECCTGKNPPASPHQPNTWARAGSGSAP